MTRALGRSLDAALARFGPAIAIHDAAGSHAFADLDRRADAVATALAGTPPNAPVIVQVANRACDLAAFIGVWRAGGAIVPAHLAMPPAVLEALIAASGATAIVDGAAVPALRRIGARLPPDPRPPDRPLLDDAAFVIFTSGSTGQPKGVVLSHEAFAGKLAAIDSWLGLDRATRMLLVLQITFSFGIWNALLTLQRGGVLVMQEKFDIAATVAALETHAITVTALVPTMLRALDARGAAPPATRLRQILTGGEPLGSMLGESVGRLFPGTELLDIYGLTETCTCDLLLGSTAPGRDAASLGRPTPGVACRIAEPDGSDTPAGAIGELLLRTPFIMRGYLDAPDLTATAFHGDWFRTGDLAVAAPDGRIRLAGRAKELISRGGNKVSPLEIEQAMQRHPAVAAALATGVPDALMGERIHLLVLPRPGAAPDLAALQDWAAEHLERFKRPDAIHLGTELPAGRTGKADRARLRAMILGGAFD